MSNTFTTLSADGQTQNLLPNYGRQRYHAVAYGVWGGGTLTFQFSPDDGVTWIDMKDGSGGLAQLSADGVFRFLAPIGEQVRVSLSGATSPTINVRISDIVEE